MSSLLQRIRSGMTTDQDADYVRECMRIKNESTESECPEESHEKDQFLTWWRGNYTDLIVPVIGNDHQGTPGVWDLFAPERYLWIEFKRRHVGELSTEQRKFGRIMLANGYRCMVAYGCDDAVRQVLHGERESWKRPKDV